LRQAEKSRQLSSMIVLGGGVPVSASSGSGGNAYKAFPVFDLDLRRHSAVQ
jgi:hypothetical protein